MRKKIFFVAAVLSMAMGISMPVRAREWGYSDVAEAEPENSVSTYTEQGENAIYRDLSSESSFMISAVNQIRTDNGLSPLQTDEVLMQAAKVRVKEIAERFAHTRPEGGDPGTATNGVYTLVGENIARGQKNTMQVMTEWMNSQSHRENILYSRYTKIGIASAEIHGRMYWVQLFLYE